MKIFKRCMILSISIIVLAWAAGSAFIAYNVHNDADCRAPLNMFIITWPIWAFPEPDFIRMESIRLGFSMCDD